MAADQEGTGQTAPVDPIPGGPSSGGAPAGSPASGAATLLPATLPVRPRRPASFWVLLGVVVVLLVLAVVLPLTLTGGKSSPAASDRAGAAARARGAVPQHAVFAVSDKPLADLAAVTADARVLLTGRLPAAHLGSTVVAALTSPPAATGSPMLAAPLSYTDPQLPNCLAGITGGVTLFGIDRVSYQGQQSFLVVTADSATGTKAFAYVIGTGCALPGTGLRTFVSFTLS